MGGIDAWLEAFLSSPSLGVVLVISLALGLRHASDPDHLAAVTTLIASRESPGRAREAGLMGLSWGLGHGTTLVLLGLPLVLLGRYLPEAVQQGAEVAIGAIIVFLGLRLLLRWRRGLFHAHPHRHGGAEEHRHLHSHAHEAAHDHSHVTRRTPCPPTPSVSCTGSADRAG